ncbi:XTP/dITP diphosphatase [Paenibacillus apiarius]|uniref:dITP/XTP pyrophosphatase n=1 Tax=Paenibacillus apiarius TaxID=46240 RepID=A0ABT4DYR0_9BACL|nr:XTP/dITP diphosphatase [Paenibacillus apiarius]MBN3525617.1 XTP/dITP diphosphatase [Paenibacillus apiarius]MCY9516501.1 XTP/dITP diphosphatase [Paenibacillus apiarius]MCY9522492.1 XTP/dITP diphosphatase [Paenibacillus apiarius]MCY9554584.1 XTP/dITP diphosphatase [Paenibacillus apiarius]MCY9556700.1 XTP/dITP diphosphatase [Paenibacillus apiarius]
MEIASNTIIIATQNKGKLKEFQLAFSPLGKQVLSMADFPHIPDIEEDGETFAENALKKAKTMAEALSLPVLADDSGLCVERLGGAPGVYSARYAGDHGNDQANNAKLLAELAKLPQMDRGAGLPLEAGAPILSQAQFVCVLALFDPASGQALEIRGTADGYIINEARGTNGFGYDPLFYLPEFGRTMAELSPEEKQSISHRGDAIRQLRQQLR